jgi:hypothetical protein
MKLIPAFGAAVLAASPCFAQSAPERGSPAGAPAPPLNTVTADNQQAGRPSFTRPYDACPGGAEQELRHQIETMVAGQPDYDVRAPKVAAEWCSLMDKHSPVTRQWGALLSLTQYSRALGSTVEYEAQFEHARVQWKIACRSSYGKITGISFKTLS